MASVFSNATMTTIFQEKVTINNTEYGSRTEVKIGGINEVVQRVVNVPTTQVTLLNLGSSVGAGTLVTGNVQYARLTNLDNENWVRLTFVSGSANQFDLRLDPEKSYVFSNAQISGSDAGGTFGSFTNFTALKAIADSSAVDLEIFVASK